MLESDNRGHTLSKCRYIICLWGGHNTKEDLNLHRHRCEYPKTRKFFNDTHTHNLRKNASNSSRHTKCDNIKFLIILGNCLTEYKKLCNIFLLIHNFITLMSLSEEQNFWTTYVYSPKSTKFSTNTLDKISCIIHSSVSVLTENISLYCNWGGWEQWGTYRPTKTDVHGWSSYLYMLP